MDLVVELRVALAKHTYGMVPLVGWKVRRGKKDALNALPIAHRT